MAGRPEVCVLKTDGINCDGEMAHAFTAAGADATVVHVNQLHNGTLSLGDFQILAIPGGFSYGDDVASGKVLAIELQARLAEQLQSFADQGKPILGVCNGFQVLVQGGLLPGGQLGEQTATLAQNKTGRFECRWIDLAVGKSVCKFVQPEDFKEPTLPMQVAHGEGRFLMDESALRELIANGQIVFRYATPDGLIAVEYPANPNGSPNGIAGVCDPSGTILGLMPHPERSGTSEHPHRARTPAARAAADVIFGNIVNYAREM